MRKMATAAAICALALPFSFLIPATPALALVSCNGTDTNNCDGIWPKDSICKNDKVIAESTTKSVYDTQDLQTDTVTANLWYSPTCHSVWGQLLTNSSSGFGGPLPGVVAYNVNGSNPQQSCTSADIPSGYTEFECSTAMVNDNGITAKAKATGYTDLGAPIVVITPAW